MGGRDTMTFWQRWARRPQNEWLRRALFQIHLWTGIGVGLYVVAVSVSGSAIVFRNEIYGAADQGPTIVEVRGEPLSKDQLKGFVAEAYPGHTIRFIWPGKESNQATEVWMDLDGSQVQRLFDPYTGEDLGPAIPYAIQITRWFMELHTDLLGGDTGRFVNGLGAVLLTLLCLTGAVLWWPGVQNWRRSLWINPRSGWKRINWDLHSAVGFWSFALVFMWAFTGVFLVWPLPFQKVVNHFSPLIQYELPEELPEEFLEEPQARAIPPGFIVAQPAPEAGAVVDPGASGDAEVAPEADRDQGQASEEGEFGKGRRGRREIRRSAGDVFLRWFYYLHFGNFAGWKTKALWVVLGFLPVLLFVTGAIMWWNRVLSRSARRSRRTARGAAT